jgi:hypothetical protein
MNHKRKRPKNARAGCLLCKPHKANGAKDRQPPAVVRRTQRARDERTASEVECLLAACAAPDGALA